MTKFSLDSNDLGLMVACTALMDTKEQPEKTVAVIMKCRAIVSDPDWAPGASMQVRLVDLNV